MVFEYRIVILADLLTLLAERDAALWTLTAIVPLNANPGELGTNASFLCIFQQ